MVLVSKAAALEPELRTNSKMAVGIPRVTQALGESTTAATWLSIGAADSRRSKWHELG